VSGMELQRTNRLDVPDKTDNQTLDERAMEPADKCVVELDDGVEGRGAKEA
jgi:hypothetical protein